MQLSKLESLKRKIQNFRM